MEIQNQPGIIENTLSGTKKVGSKIKNFLLGDDDDSSVLISKLQQPVKISTILDKSKNGLLENLMFSSDMISNLLFNKPTERILSKIIILVDDHINFFGKYPEIYFQYEKGFYGNDWEIIKDTIPGKRLATWHEISKSYFNDYVDFVSKKNLENNIHFGKGIIKGSILGMGIGAGADLWEKKGEIAEGITRFFAGNGDTIFSSGARLINILRAKLSGEKSIDNENSDYANDNIQEKTQEEINSQKTTIYAIFSTLGMFVGPVLHFISTKYPSESALMSALYSSGYSNSDNLSGTLGTLVFNIKHKGSILGGLEETFNDPFHSVNLTVILGLFMMNFLVLSSGIFIVDTQTLAAVHGILLNVDSILVALGLYIYNAGNFNNLLNELTDKRQLKSIIEAIN